MSGALNEIRIRFATIDDVGLLLRCIRDLAAYEGAPNAVVATEEDLRRYGFGPEWQFEALLAFLDGKPAGPLFGSAVQAQERYRALRQAILEELKQPPEAKVTLTASRKDDDIDMTAEVSASSGAEVRLRFVLVEELAKYPAGNGQYEHHQVVRVFPGGMDGFAVTAAPQKHTASIKVSEVRRILHDELTSRGLPAERQPLALAFLAVIEYVL